MSNVYGMETLVGNWGEVRVEPKFQPARMVKNVYRLPTKSGKNWGKTSDAYGSTFKEEMNLKLNSLRIEHVLQYGNMTTKEQYATTARREFGNPAEKPVPDHKERHTPEFLEAYRKQWTNGEPHQYVRKEL